MLYPLSYGRVIGAVYHDRRARLPAVGVGLAHLQFDLCVVGVLDKRPAAIVPDTVPSFDSKLIAVASSMPELPGSPSLTVQPWPSNALR